MFARLPALLAAQQARDNPTGGFWARADMGPVRATRVPRVDRIGHATFLAPGTAWDGLTCVLQALPVCCNT